MVNFVMERLPGYEEKPLEMGNTEGRRVKVNGSGNKVDTFKTELFKG